MVEEAKELGKDLIKNTKEVVVERFFSPMYFYFIIAWVICNWKFMYSIIFQSSDALDTLKIDYLLKFYPTDSIWDILYNIWSLFLAPAVSTYIVIWWFSILSEKSYERFEKYKSNKRTIFRKLEYTEKVVIATEQRKIREQESDKDELRYIDNEDFNTWLDESQENIQVLGVDYLPSEILFNTDPTSYKEQLNEFLIQKNNEE